MMKIVASIVVSMALVMPAAAQRMTVPERSKADLDNFKNFVCDAHNRGVKTPFDVQLQKECGVRSRVKFSCQTVNHGLVEGTCADSWWTHFWNDLPYCDEIQYWCELGSGVFKLID